MVEIFFIENLEKPVKRFHKQITHTLFFTNY
jgi:hypothetical protein